MSVPQLVFSKYFKLFVIFIFGLGHDLNQLYGLHLFVPLGKLFTMFNISFLGGWLSGMSETVNFKGMS